MCWTVSLIQLSTRSILMKFCLFWSNFVYSEVMRDCQNTHTLLIQKLFFMYVLYVGNSQDTTTFRIRVGGSKMIRLFFPLRAQVWWKSVVWYQQLRSYCINMSSSQHMIWKLNKLLISWEICIVVFLRFILLNWIQMWKLTGAHTYVHKNIQFE